MNTVVDTFSKKAIVNLIETYGEVECFYEDFNGSGCDVFVLENGSLIRLPTGYERIDYEHVVLIAIEKLELPSMEFDYWLGEQ